MDNTYSIYLVIFSAITFIFSIVIHEVAHGGVAYFLGDPTAKYEGRLTLNPLKHIDFFGSIILPLIFMISASFGFPSIIIGWAKPVPVNPYNYRDKKWGELKVAIAGPGSNFLIALFFGFITRILFVFSPSSFFILPFYVIVAQNLLLGVFNSIPIPPLDGSWILFSFLSPKYDEIKHFLSQYGLIILLFIIFLKFNWIMNIVSFLFSLIIGR